MIENKKKIMDNYSIKIEVIKHLKIMPIYEYKCAKCGNRLEVMQKISDAPLTECPRCHEEKLEKQWSLSGFQFKGSGWYVSDYTNRGKETAVSDNKNEAKAGETKSEGGKPADSAAISNSNGSDGASGSKTNESTASTNIASKSETKTSTAD